MTERGPQSPARRKLHQRFGELGLRREERLALASYFLRRDLSSFDDLDGDQVRRLLDGIEIAELILELYAQRPPETTM